MLCKATQKSFHRIYSSRPGVCQIPYLTCPRSLRAYVLTRKRALRAFCAKVPTCVRAINTNNKNKFSVICFLYTFVIAISFFFLWNKTVVHSCVIVYKKTDECYNEGYNEWQRVVQLVTTNYNEWYNKWQRMTTSGTRSDKEWQGVIQRVTRVTTNGNEWYHWYNEWKRHSWL